jgi:hypothetical protein
MPPLNLYARVRFFVHVCTRDRGCSAHPVFPAPSAFEEGEVTQTSGGSRRENASARHEAVIASEAKQSMLHPLRDGLLRCARNDAEVAPHPAFGRIASGVSGCASGCAVENSGIAIDVS